MPSSKSVRKRIRRSISSRRNDDSETKGKPLTGSPTSTHRALSARADISSPKQLRGYEKPKKDPLFATEVWTPSTNTSTQYEPRPKEKFDKKIEKLERKAPKQANNLRNKINQICNNPSHNYHRMHGDEHDKFHVHIEDHFVLIFKINHEERAVELLDYGHHNEFFE